MSQPRKMVNEKLKMTLQFDNRLGEEILSFDYYNYRLENLAKRIRSKNVKQYIRACE